LKLPQLSAAPSDIAETQRKNYIYVQIDAVGIGLSAAAAAFLPVFLTRAGATNSQVGLLTSMPALTGLILAIPIGRFLQTRRQIVPWFSLARLFVISCYALTGLAPFVVSKQTIIPVVLGIWAFATLPQTVVMVCFSVVMNAVAGPTHRYDLMSRRWSILGITTALTVTGIGQMLDRITFPLDYQLAFILLSLGGLISYYFSSRISLPDNEAPPATSNRAASSPLRQYVALVASQQGFINFVVKRLVYQFGWLLAIPLFPLYYVRVVEASDAWIGLINTVQSAVLLVGYFIWTLENRLRGARFVLLWTTAGLAIYPALIASTMRIELIMFYAGLAGIFQAGLDLVFFDELLKTVPPQYSATFISLAQSVQYFAAVFAPLIGTTIAGEIGLGGALLVSAFIRLVGFFLFAGRGRSA
jgi:hypothetical protein